MGKQVPVGVYDLDRLAGFLYSVESLVVMAKTMEGRWSPADMNPLIDGMYWVSSWIGTVKPGAFEISGGQGNMLQVWINVTRGLEMFLEKSARSPAEGLAYIRGLQNQRKAAVAKVTGLIQNATSINAEVGKQAQAAARAAADVQFATAVIGAGISCFISMGATAPVLIRTGAQFALQGQRITAGTRAIAGGVGAAGNIGGSYLKDLAYQNDFTPELSASVQGASNIWEVNTYKAIIVENAKKGIEHGVGKATANTAYGRAHAHAAELERAVARGQAKVDQLHRALGQQLKHRARQKARQNLGRAATAQLGLQQAAHAGERAAHAAATPAKTLNYAGSVAHRGLPMIFLAYDVWDAWGDLKSGYEYSQ